MVHVDIPADLRILRHSSLIARNGIVESGTLIIASFDEERAESRLAPVYMLEVLRLLRCQRQYSHMSELRHARELEEQV